MPALVAAFACGLLFGLGLIVSAMVDPAKVRAFLDIFGNWDPSLALVMAGAVAVAALGYALARRRGAPLCAARLDLPARRDLDARLIGGSALFGAGWGLAGLCPGPALTGLGFAPSGILVFVAAMLAGMALVALLDRPRAPPLAAADG